MQISAIRCTACLVLALAGAPISASAGQEPFFTTEQAAQIAAQQMTGQALLTESLRAQLPERMSLERARLEAKSRDRHAAAEWSAAIGEARAAQLGATTSTIGGDLARQMDGMFRASSEADARKTEAMYEHLTDFHADWAALQNAREDRASRQQQQLVAAGLAAAGAMTGNPAMVAAGGQAAVDSAKPSPPLTTSRSKGGASPKSLPVGRSFAGGGSPTSLAPAAASPSKGPDRTQMPTVRRERRIPIVDSIAERSGAFCGAGNEAELPPGTGPACYQFYKPDGSPDNTNSACFVHDIELELSGKRFWQVWDPEVQQIHSRLANSTGERHFQLLFNSLAGFGRVLNNVGKGYEAYGESLKYGAIRPY